jgi:hypothetical protein
VHTLSDHEQSPMAVLLSSDYQQLDSCLLSRWTNLYPFDQQSRATLGPDSTLMGANPIEKYAGCCLNELDIEVPI